MHLDFTVSLGSVFTLFAIIGGIWRVERFLRTTDALLQRFSIEHEVLIRDYCERHGVKVGDFPTRMKGLA